MCNKKVDCLSESDLQSECHIDQRHHREDLMDSPTVTPGSHPSSNDENNARVKFLCSFSGSILPRPQDGKLRYVGGETRIVSVPRDITYEDLMVKMRELYEGVTVLKYQQPDEDLDALVSVVNDDDVMNMMEEYDKLGAGDGFTRLRIFLFSQSDQDGSVHFVDGDERDNERRYVDALNSLNESPDFRRQQPGEFQIMGPLEDVHFAEQYLNHTSLESGLHNHRNFEMPMAQINLRHLRIPHLGTGQPQQSVSQRINDMEAPWSPAYYSPRQTGTHDPRPVAEFPTSPSSGRYHTPYGEFPDKSLDRMPEEYNRHQLNHPPLFEHPPQYAENLVFLPAGAVASEKGGFPGNILHGSNVFEGNSICEHCRMAFPRNQAYSDSPWKPGEQSHMDSPSMANGFHQVSNICAECPPNRDILLPNADANVHHPSYLREQNDIRSLYSETHCHDGGWNMQHQSRPQAEESRHVSVAGRLPDHYIADNGVPLGHGNTADRHHMPVHRGHQEDPRYMLGGPELGNQMFQDQVVTTGSPVHVPPIEECVIRYGNSPYAYGLENVYQVHHGQLTPHTLWRNVHSPMNGGPYDASVSPQVVNGSINPGFMRITMDSPRLRPGVDSQNPWVDSSQRKLGIDGSPLPEHSCGQSLRAMPNAYNVENHPSYVPEATLLPSDIPNLKIPSDPVTKSASASLVADKLVLTTSEPKLIKENNVTYRVEEKPVLEGEKETKGADPFDIALSVPLQRIGQGEPSKVGDAVNGEENSAYAPVVKMEPPDDRLSFLPELIASMKKATLQSVKEVKAKVQDNDVSIVERHSAAKEAQHEPDAMDTNGDGENDSDNDNITNSKIEPTTAEEEAIKRGLQTIKNEDLEEIRELGSGTYGAVFHGKWKGSDVAIKRIKASCFAGRPSERERLIADFWKEALILSSLHHPNVVSFYGVVRDGPDGSLATVTEFMVNGSLKQFLQKKDRTIDRRKRLIIAMDAAFGMEYLHGKNIVHFDLKCENLLVNMRDPHRPVCKIGDLGLSKVKQHTLVSGGVRGTLPWMAPELLSGKSNMVTEKIDVYSFGIVMWELLTGDEPYADMHCANIIGGIVNNTLRPDIPTWCDPEWKALMGSCWASDPAQRPSFSEISQKLRNMAAAMNVK